ncbi:MAG: ATP-binding protein [Lentilitoribacter sp.]
MAEKELSKIELLAEKATSLPAFGINLLDIRRNVEQILSQFGKDGLFSEYTPHDMSHIDDMLLTATWIIPENTKEIMTSGDWLMLVLCIYFHDMGLVVTKDEFSNRKKTGFPTFCKEILYADSDGSDYKAKVDSLEETEKEKFLYQEFVRHNHPVRVKTWIEGKKSDLYGYCKSQVEIISNLLAPLSAEFRTSLGQVCESHGLDDLEDCKKYFQNAPFGNNPQETVNKQYISALLRTIDLIQITSRRAPSSLYRLIDPVDPISQQEWAKQNKVRTVRAQIPLDSDGIPAPKQQSDTIEIFANFDEEIGFFGLNSYIRYATEQLKETHAILERTKHTSPKPYSFPWKNIDDSNIMVEGFEQEPFGFEIDQEKILDLLTGHTLYNNSNVVIRELTQNAVDAVRLQNHESGEKNGKVHVHWNTDKSRLTIRDNGTGMTQEVIENNLLKVGSSRYQSSKFKEKYPDFNPISRFGIGVLTAFMVADTVEIKTICPAEELARSISLRSVHGKYLIKLIEKDYKGEIDELGAHGTSFTLTFRASAKRIDVEEALKNYVMFPDCDVELQINGEHPSKIGYDSPKSALEDYLQAQKTANLYGRTKTEVREVEAAGVKVAYAMAYSSHYRDWQFVRSRENRTRSARQEKHFSPVSTCIEGIVVHKGLIGEFDPELVAVVNLTGQKAPKTNVARTAIEATSELERSASIINRVLLKAVESERVRLVGEENYSLTWAVEQMPLLMLPIIHNKGRTNNTEVQVAKSQELKRTKIYLGEIKGKRDVYSCADLENAGKFWTTDSVLLNSTEQLVREAKREVPRTALLKLVYGDSAYVPDELVVSNIKNFGVAKDLVNEEFEIDYLKGSVEEKRLDARWVKSSGLWIEANEIVQALLDLESSEVYDFYNILLDHLRHTRTSSSFDTYFPVKPDKINCAGLEGYDAIRTSGDSYFLPHSPIAKYFSSLEGDWKNSIDDLRIAFFVSVLCSQSIVMVDSSLEHVVNSVEKLMNSDIIKETSATFSEAKALLNGTGKINCYDPLSWRQRALDGTNIY